ncbi:MAG: GNAT family N-acetyltransferase, partial [Saprospiraceae bacterium]|nr:GNAT family N-acetyltransferase [Saprospiraceae bacterium]
SFKTFRGSEIANVFESLGKLRITVFKAWPYLYEGSLEYEVNYLKTYAQSSRSFLFAAFDGDEMIGATTCIPLLDETSEVQEPFLKAGMDLSKIFYFGESILLPQYRGHGLGHRFFEEREAHAHSFGSYEHTCFCGVVRPADHPARPADYRPLDAFWRKRGYQPQPQLQSQFEWLDIGEAEATHKPMLYWMKYIND